MPFFILLIILVLKFILFLHCHLKIIVMEKLSFINSAFALVSKLPVTDVFVTLKDGNESVISCKFDCNLLLRHFEILSESRLYVALDVKTSSLIIRPGDWLPF